MAEELNNNEQQNNEQNHEESQGKTFTQDQVNSMIAAEKRKNTSSFFKSLGFESEDAAKAFVDKYKGQEEKNKTDLVKAFKEVRGYN